jgi:transcriptional regulator with XRE-family HTH domain
MSQKTPGQRIERARLLHHWSQSDLAARLEANQSSVHRWEHDTFLPTVKTQEKLITVLGLPDDVFVKQRRKTKRNKSKKPSPRALSKSDHFTGVCYPCLEMCTAHADPIGSSSRAENGKSKRLLIMYFLLLTIRSSCYKVTSINVM